MGPSSQLRLQALLRKVRCWACSSRRPPQPFSDIFQPLTYISGRPCSGAVLLSYRKFGFVLVQKNHDSEGSCVSLHELMKLKSSTHDSKLTIVPHFSPSITAKSWTSMIFAHSESCKSLIFDNLRNHGVHAANHERAAGSSSCHDCAAWSSGHNFRIILNHGYMIKNHTPMI